MLSMPPRLGVGGGRWHEEHHMYADVPCYNLRKLRQAIDLPVAKNAIAAFRELRATWKRQQVEPGYQHDTPLPPTANPGNDAAEAPRDDDLSSPIGDLAPAELFDLHG